MAATLRGPRRARQRLLDEVTEDLKDAVEAESAAGLSPDAAEALVAARFGNPTAIARHWNSDQALRRRSMQRNALLLMTAMAMAGGLGITQYASGKNSPTPIPTRGCPLKTVPAKVSNGGGLPEAGGSRDQTPVGRARKCALRNG
jgi:hypothetical protein